MAQLEERIVHLNYVNETIGTILNDLESVFGLEFSYGRIPLEKPTSFQYNGPLDRAIESFFSRHSLLFRRIGERIVLKLDTPLGQPIKGIITDAVSKIPLIGAHVIVIGSNPQIGTTSDAEGHFSIEQLKVGRYDLQFDYLGYEPLKFKQILVTTGKQRFLSVDMKESTLEMEEVVIVGKFDASIPLNEMATNSARSFSVEETSRYAAAISDPARMVQSFAGVTGNGDDLSNEIIIRGNSAQGLLWRMDGVEIPNPNHFSDLGSGGGNISMLSSSTLTNSDFYTGAFPAEFGNALSGVFDLKLRSGNNEKREHSFQVGTLGIEASTEGYFTKKSPASYLINYRYSTIALIKDLLPNLAEKVHPFQDLSFKINIPTSKAGTFSMFGLGGKNSTFEKMRSDTSNFKFKNELAESTVEQGMQVIGLTHRYLLSDRSYLHTSLSSSKWRYSDETIQLQPSLNFVPWVIDVTDFSQSEIFFGSSLNHKASAKNSLRAGFNIRFKSYRYDYKSFGDSDNLISFLDNEGSTLLSDFYAQWKHQLKPGWELNSGINISYLTLNGSMGVDPRAAIKYEFKPNQSLSLSTGIYSKPAHISTYFIERTEIDGLRISPNRDLPMLKAFHLAGAYDINFSEELRFKVEAYFQHLFDIPVGINKNTVFSLLNASNIFGIIFLNDMDGAQLVPEGTGKNYGLEITLEKFFSQRYYFLTTLSLFDSKFTTVDGRQFHTRYATNYVTNALAGKEWAIGTRKKNALGFNFRMTSLGGLRSSPILLTASARESLTIYDESRFNSKHNPAYFRFDLGIFYRVNSESSTHSFSIDMQNLTDRRNVAVEYFDPVLEGVTYERQSGFIPFINYRIEF